MKIRIGKWLGIIIICLAVVGVIYAACLSQIDHGMQKAVAETRKELQQQGFKTELKEFNFSTSPELRLREAALTAFSPAMRSRALFEHPNLMTPVGDNSAMVVWKQEWLPTGDDNPYGDTNWTGLQVKLGLDQSALDAACKATLIGPIRFNLEASHGSSMLLRHLAGLKSLAQSFGSRAVLELHDDNPDYAWTNLLAATRLVTAWEPESVDVSHLVRFGCMKFACDATWQALQTNHWPDARLAQLQSEWESVDFFRNLPETVAFQRASAVDLCQRERREPLELGLPLMEILKTAFRSPRSAGQIITAYWRQLRYRGYGTYEDEKNLLLHFRDREQELRQAIQSPTWLAMQPLPGVTNPVLFISKHSSRMQCVLNTKALSTAWHRLGASFLSRAAEAEARRRLLITAIALERYHERQGSYPPTLQALVPEWFKNPPMDFMDGQPLRYRPTDDGYFVLYSVGLDCVDDGGKMPVRDEMGNRFSGFGVPLQTDLVWPRPASAAEVEALRQAEMNAQKEQANLNEEEAAFRQWAWSASRQAEVGKLLAGKPTPGPADKVYRGRSLRGILRNKNTSTNQLSLADMLTLKQVVTGREPETVTFEVPLAYDALTNLGRLHLYVDPDPKADFEEGSDAGLLECARATNGNCLLVWHTIYESPGKHALQLGLELDELESTENLAGPITPFEVGNLCQFSLASVTFDPNRGATLHAQLPEERGIYRIELYSPAQDLLKTFTGSRIIKEHWDLTNDQGLRCTNDFFDSVFQITLPDSGRSQTLKGP